MDQSKKRLLKSLMDSWFSSMLSTESMLRGTVNEGAVLLAFRKDFLLEIFECGMLCMKDSNWFDCSPESVALIDVQGLDVNGEHVPQLASVEFKTIVASSSLDKAHRHLSPDFSYCTMGDSNFVRLIPQNHCGQLLQQSVFLQLQYVVYVAASNTGIIEVQL